MPDKRFIAVNRSGSLTKEQHYQLMNWACECVENVLPLLGESIYERLINALLIAKEWTQGKATVGDERNASVQAHDVARASSNPVKIALARAVGHAVATAHMADHSLEAAVYALKAVKYAGKSVEEERNRQNELLPLEIKELVLSTRGQKEQGFIDLRNISLQSEVPSDWTTRMPDGTSNCILKLFKYYMGCSPFVGQKKP
ncbi:MAG: hypothetical protein HW421_862 [Ignavibacteria bacterium]|nr:hypothetical protein [Ignavibacteria bacterium]